MIILNIGVLAKAKGLSIQDLADKAEISYNTAKGLYRGYTTRIDLPILDKVCTILGVSPGDLLTQIADDDIHAGYQTMAKLRIKELAQQHGITTAAELAREAKIGQTTAYKLWDGSTYQPNIDTLIAIADALGVKIDDLIIHE
ncbi:helix-turn-helix domain-containing protein [Herpetosiphon llansteffanensis]|uniref:helix-turn-helix domain-containing protein n=1 Tax=Herpetosiphon llansteffanensis TaxID=2094568 RepID=UPI000D7B9673|nr:helix-turn-helix transcriptional regulator [Herpetosiphon llansteffanensis]